MYGATTESRSAASGSSVDAGDVGTILAVYFPEAEVSAEDDNFRLTSQLIRFLSTPPGRDLASQVRDDNGLSILPLDFQQFRKLCDVELFYELLEQKKKPKEALLCMSAAVHKVLMAIEDNDRSEVDRKINIRLYNYPESMIALKNLKAAYIGKSKSKNQGFYYLYLEAVSVRNSKSQSTTEDSRDTISDGRATELFDSFSFTSRDLEFIVKFHEEYSSDIFRQILQSICPSIYGHELVKAGITLALFGGVQKHSMDQNKVPVRGDIHVIIVGDPGLGKSQLLQAAAAVSPRGIYVCGNATTNAGLTVAVVKDAMTSDYAFEAGAMVLADRGLCCIDEFDKMSAEHQALLEAMEQQCVSIAKAGLVASLSARTSILAAANPVGGHYNRAKTVNENLKMSAALLSRFDLVFILLDKPDELLDKQVSEHIMSLHAGYGEHLPVTKKPIKDFSASSIKALQNGGAVDLGVKGSLVSRLRLDPRESSEFVPLPAPLIRKYIAYARSYVFPRMSKPAAEILQKFYLRLRDHSTSADSTPITARQLESLVRLAEARARVDLREEITVQDALDVVEIMKESLFDKYMDEHGFVDFGRSSGMSQQKEAKRFLSALNKQSELQQKDCFSISEIYSLADRISLRVPDIDTFVDNLNSVGYLLKKGPRTYQVLSSSYSKSQSSRARG
ncbi:probable DNA helicase MCM8 isoform X2 [Syzygium oleosum]|uniref:probable DNA helicase MCM8 isoform X2 n=1 Tax=Syzygium oleosum TaxID=219896 RepID=UPI0024BB4F59|nr:probable DNA helicase MCM8 isoform X2 [Syzygium oleosum]